MADGAWRKAWRWFRKHFHVWRWFRKHFRAGHILAGLELIGFVVLLIYLVVVERPGEACSVKFNSIAESLKADLAPPGSVRPGTEPISLTADTSNQAIDVTLGTLRQLARTVTLDTSEPMSGNRPVFASVRGDLVQSESGSILSQDQVLTRTFIRRGSMLSVAVCFNPAKRQIDSGKYEGAVSIHGDGIETFNLPVNVAVRYPNLPVVYLVAFAGIVFGLYAKALSDVLGQTAKEPWTRRLWDYMAGPLFATSTLIGLGLAIYAVFSLYLGNASFGQSPMDWVSLFGFGFAGVVGGMTFTDLAAALKKKQLADEETGAKTAPKNGDKTK
jgi:hypothetical protein